MVKRRKSKTKVKNGIEYYYKRIELGRDPLTGKRIQKELLVFFWVLLLL